MNKREEQQTLYIKRGYDSEVVVDYQDFKCNFLLEEKKK
jgi:hypothetical protein